MLNFSLSSVIMAVLTSNLLIVILSVIFLNRSILYKFGLPLLGIFGVLITLRMLMPFELNNITQNIYFPERLSKAIVFICHPRIQIPFFGKTISIWHIFTVVWIIGFLILLFHYIYINHKTYVFFSTYGADVTKRPEYVHIIDTICKNEELKKKISVIKLPFPQIPSVIQHHSHYYIVIPNKLTLSNEETMLVFRHEITHIINHDLIYKFIVQIMCYFYWWNPLCIFLKRRINMFLELRIDLSIISEDAKQAQDYLDCLLKIAKYNLKIKKNMQLLSRVMLIPINSSELKKRFAYITQEEEKNNKALCGFLLASACTLCILSYLFIFEDSYMYPEHMSKGEYSITPENTFIIQNKDNTYDIYFKGEFFETVNSLEYYPEDCKIYLSLEEALKNEKE